MGGQLAWTLRLEDGTQYRMNTWTNSLAERILNDAFLAGKPDAIQDSIQDWIDMKDDWAAHQEDKNFAYPMTQSYGPYPYGMRPSEYGLVVTDFVSKKILSLQGYTDLGSVLDVRQHFGSHVSTTFSTKVDRLQSLHREGRIAGWEFVIKFEDGAQPFLDLGATSRPHPNDQDARIVWVPGNVDYEALTRASDRVRNMVPPHPEQDKLEAMREAAMALIDTDPNKDIFLKMIEGAENSHKSMENPIVSVQAKLKTAPFDIEEFEESAQGYRALYARIQELGFDLSEDEKTAWQRRILFCEEN